MTVDSLALYTYVVALLEGCGEKVDGFSIINILSGET